MSFCQMNAVADTRTSRRSINVIPTTQITMTTGLPLPASLPHAGRLDLSKSTDMIMIPVVIVSRPVGSNHRGA